MSKLEIRTYTSADSEAVVHLHNVALEAAGAHVRGNRYKRFFRNDSTLYVHE